MEIENSNHDPLDFIEGCFDGTECPEAGFCRSKNPDVCPLIDDQFIIPVGTPLDRMLNNTY